MAVDGRGVATEVHRFAVRILHISGRNNATGRALYNDSADKILTSDAWLIRAGSLAHPIKNSDWIDMATNADGCSD